MRNVFIVIEGLTGSGKSTIAEALARRIGGITPQLMTPGLKAAQSEVEDDPTKLDVRYALFIAASLGLASRVQGLLGAGAPVVVDSWHYRTVATHECLGSSLRWDPPIWLPVPTVAVFLDLEDRIRHQRITERGRASGHWKRMCEQHSAAIKARYRELAPTMRWVDSSASVDSIVDTIEEMIS